MPEKAWKAFEKRMARDVGTERIPVTGERNGADCANGLFCFQFKLRKTMPGWLWEWLAGIVANAQTSGRVGVLVLKKPRQRDTDAIVVLRWQDWQDLHGRLTPKTDIVSKCRTCGEFMSHGHECFGLKS